MQRMITPEGCFNPRDPGGYPMVPGHRIRWRRMLRDDARPLLTTSDVDRLTVPSATMDR